MNRDKAVSLHSRYNPQAEAERYINSLALPGGVRFFILVEPGLGYMISPLRKKFPAAKIVALHAEERRLPADAAPEPGPETNTGEARGTPPDSEWFPGTELSAGDFLEREIPDREAAEIRLIEWRPALPVYGAAYLSLIAKAAEFIKRADANSRTLKTFGRRWFRNFFKNLKIMRQVLNPLPCPLPVFIAGAGPGLEDALPLVKKEAGRGALFVLAVSSSVAALEAAGIVPGMVISTDGGSWAKFHLYEMWRGGYAAEGAELPLAAALNAALPSQCGKLPILPISDGSLWQRLILKELEIPFVTLPQRGTVSAAALDLAFALSGGDIYIAGFDLANRDIRSHARPYSFDRFSEENASKLNPLYSHAYKRSSALRDGGTYGIYASWFKNQLASYPKRLHTLGNNNPLFAGLEKGSFKKTRGKENAGIRKPYFTVSPLKPESGAAEKALLLLKKALAESRRSKALREELSPLLLAGRGEDAAAKDRRGEDAASLNGTVVTDEIIGVMRSLVIHGEKI